MRRPKITTKSDSASAEIEAKVRFKFGENWRRFIEHIDDARILSAEKSLQNFTRLENFSELKFLDVGCGSGLFSLAARNLGAEVMSFDYDSGSVACARHLRKIFRGDDDGWAVVQGSVLDTDFMEQLQNFDIVYAWGVLHHSGDLSTSIEKTANAVKPGGLLYLAVYNRQRFASAYWLRVKRAYVRFPLLRPFLYLVHFIYPTLPSLLLRLVSGRRIPRGMAVHSDLLDWLGGLPFEVATPQEVVSEVNGLGFSLVNLKTVGFRSGCNEFLFTKS